MAHIKTSRQKKSFFKSSVCVWWVLSVNEAEQLAACLKLRARLRKWSCCPCLYRYVPLADSSHRLEGQEEHSNFRLPFPGQWHVKSSQKNGLPGTVRLVSSNGKHSPNSLDRKFLQDFCSWWQPTFFAYIGILAQQETFPSFRSSGSFSVGSRAIHKV